MAASDPRIARIGFCKLKGEGVEHYAKKYEIIIGRKSKSTALDVAIGDNMNISRQHASIVYNFEKRAWELRVHGKNGVTVRDTLYTPNSPPVVLQSGDLLQLGDRSFFFLLEKGSRARQKAAKRQRPPSASTKAPAARLQQQQQHELYGQPQGSHAFASRSPAVAAAQVAEPGSRGVAFFAAQGQPGAGLPPGVLSPTVLQAMIQQRQQQQQLAGAGVPVSPLLQQLMAANSASRLPAAGVAAQPQMAGLVPEQQQRFPYPEGFPQQLLQGLQNHQQLQQQILAQAAPSQVLTQEQAARLASSDDQSSAAANPGQ